MAKLTSDDLLGHWSGDVGGGQIQDHIYMVISKEGAIYRYQAFDSDKGGLQLSGTVSFHPETSMAPFVVEGTSAQSFRLVSGELLLHAAGRWRRL